MKTAITVRSTATRQRVAGVRNLKKAMKTKKRARSWGLWLESLRKTLNDSKRLLK
jgi:hypothetical protein